MDGGSSMVPMMAAIRTASSGFTGLWGASRNESTWGTDSRGQLTDGDGKFGYLEDLVVAAITAKAGLTDLWTRAAAPASIAAPAFTPAPGTYTSSQM